jgi:hypothetical protein
MITPRVQAIHSIACLGFSVLIAIALPLPSCPAQQLGGTPTGVTPQSTQPRAGAPLSATQPQPTAPGDDLSQMRMDLNRMEGLLGNMSSEIEFLRDQNLQILLRTNAQMWTTLIRDLRREVDREEQRRSHTEQPQGDSAVPSPPRH